MAINFEDVKEGMSIKFIGDFFAFEGDYKTVKAESTYEKPEYCPENEKGKLLIIEFGNDDTPMFFVLDSLDPAEWELVDL